MIAAVKNEMFKEFDKKYFALEEKLVTTLESRIQKMAREYDAKLK
jgi:hypothetical protein